MRYDFEKDGLLTKCVLRHKDLEFTGYSKCLEEDKEFYSVLTGEYIAANKALIKYNKYLLNEVRLKRKTLFDFYQNIAASKKYNYNSYINLRLVEEIERLDKLIEKRKLYIFDLQESLKDYLEKKDNLHKKFKEIVRK